MKRINLALQGGGAHGAFTWGALDRLLEDDEIDIAAISATSAGAMNGAMLISGLAEGGREGARTRLRAFWEEIGDRSPAGMSPFTMFALPGVPPEAMARFYELSPFHVAGDMLSRVMSPYQFNPLNINPLREILARHVNFSHVCGAHGPRLIVNATNVRTGRPKLFTGDAITIDALLASACLPFLFQTVMIDGEGYWDGGYVGNPAIYPLFEASDCRDVLVVHINPIDRPTLPHSAADILNRVNEISFNSSLLREFRAINFVRRLIDQGALTEESYRRILIHSVRDEDAMRKLGVATKLYPDPRIIASLFDSGRAAMDRWMQAHRDKIGVESSVDVQAEFL